ncbi:alpha/beta hydrolase [Thalassotalea sp. 1_MG-2023]|uniref:alpha/beta fold hydrolase n=1 Tax=Thalassotalea sp. 1_MG-2023 TaxID=3062680 RepID=UPI0026E2DEED|nr:alpha/beta hydrolase [Thalassotalea sp. 1_MG-2023]MDO6427854.1 alpha/beta hydrolase [Thalassotalea sp. 1_MG-2023]
MISEYTASPHGMHIAGLTSGPHSERPILCLHGWLDNAASFTPLMQCLSNHSIVAIDWPGHGHSDHRSKDAHYHFLDYVYDLVLLFEQQKWSTLDIIGHSMGGMIAQAFAAAFPEKVASLTLIDAIGFITDEPDNTAEQLRKGLLSRIKSTDKSKPLHPTIESAIKARISVSDLNEKDASLIVNRGLKKVEHGYTWRADSKLKNISPYRLTEPQATSIVNNIDCPVQLISGDKGLGFVARAIDIFKPYFKTLTINQLSGGHHVHMESPEKTAKLVDEFIQKPIK